MTENAMPDNKDTDYYSEPVQEIMGTVPSWITRWGVTVIFSVLAAVIAGSCLIRYPQTLEGRISITYSKRPVELISGCDGLIDSAFVCDGQAVAAGEPIILLDAFGRKEARTVTAPISGNVLLCDYLMPGQHLGAGEVIASIVPDSASGAMGRMKVSSAGLGKVKAGQTVNVRLDGFPYMEYGIVKGRVSHVFSVPETLPDGTPEYTVAVEFPHGLMTTYRKTLPLIQQMDGTAEIVTQDKRLISLFLGPAAALFKGM